jgi:uncharacterized membrane protein (DUF2068 family)
MTSEPNSRLLSIERLCQSSLDSNYVNGEMARAADTTMLMVVTRHSAGSRSSAANRGSTALVLIGVFKLLKGLLLVAAGVGALKLLHKDIADVVTRWVEMVRIDPDSRFIHGLLTKLFATTSKQLKDLSVGLFIYAGLFLTEGIGLLLRKHWAEYLTVITTSALIPLEVYELAKRFSTAKLAILAVNVAIVWYLIERIRERR